MWWLINFVGTRLGAAQVLIPVVNIALATLWSHFCCGGLSPLESSFLFCTCIYFHCCKWSYQFFIVKLYLAWVRKNCFFIRPLNLPYWSHPTVFLLARVVWFYSPSIMHRYEAVWSSFVLVYLAVEQYSTDQDCCSQLYITRYTSYSMHTYKFYALAHYAVSLCDRLIILVVKLTLYVVTICHIFHTNNFR